MNPDLRKRNVQTYKIGKLEIMGLPKAFYNFTEKDPLEGPVNFKLPRGVKNIILFTENLFSQEYSECTNKSSFRIMLFN